MMNAGPLVPRSVFINRSLVVDIIDDHIQVAVIIEVDISCAIRESRLRQSPFSRYIGKPAIAIILKSIIVQFYFRDLRQCPFL